MPSVCTETAAIGFNRLVIEVVQATANVRALLRYGLTVRDIADVLEAHPKAIETLISPRGPCRRRG